MWMVKTNYLAPWWGISFRKKELANRVDVYYWLRRNPKMRVVKVRVQEVT
jgi:hypothetical protein